MKIPHQARFLQLFLFHQLFSICVATLSLAASTSVMTQQGPVLGKVQGSITVFRGIPYAAPPVGELRWHAPISHASWSTPFSAFQDGAICVQPKEVGKQASVGNEDCLTLNIWAPSSKTPLPVMVFIHGGFYVVGSSDTKEDGFVRIQDGLELAKQGQVIVVSFNYRLGAFGFFASDALNDGSIESQSGNFGLMDQLAALHWIHDNIASFGGDPSRLTVFGQSAGASSVLTLMASPLAEGLFSQAIVQSGYLKAIPRTEAFELSAKLIHQSGCEKSNAKETADCLRALPSARVISSVLSSASEGSNGLFVPNFDGYVIKESLEDAYRLGHVRKIPVMMGTNTDETASLVKALYGPAIKTDAQLEQKMTASYGKAVWEKAKPLYASGSAQESLIQLSTDLIFTCAGSSLLRSQPKAWRYVFAHSAHVPFLSRLGAFHGLELLYVFGSLPKLFDLIPAERNLSIVMRDYWSNFAKKRRSQSE